MLARLTQAVNLSISRLGCAVARTPDSLGETRARILPGMQFQWLPWLTGPGLAYGRTFVATVDVSDCVRVTLHPNIPRLLRHEFVADEAAGRRYVEGWRRKWETELRELYAPLGEGKPDRPAARHAAF